jgi:putative MATE family efflux protein
MALFQDGMRGHERNALHWEIWRLAWPVCVGQGLNAVVSFISRLVIAQLGDKAFYVVSLGTQVFFLVVIVIAAIGVGTTALVAQSWGAGDKKMAGRVMQQSLIFGFVLCLGIVAVGIPVSRLLYQLMGTDEESVRMGTNFLFILILSIPFLAPGFFLGSALRGAGDTKTPMIVGIFMSGISLFLAYGLILGKFGMPRLGVTGAALATAGAFFVQTLILFIVVALNLTLIKLPLKGWRPDWKLGKSIFMIGVPSAAEWFLIMFGLLVYIKVVSYYGEAAAAGYFAAFAILGFAQTPAFGLQTAAATLVGQNVGAKNIERAESVFRHCALLGFALMAVIGIMLGLVNTPSLLAVLFDKLTPESIEYAETYIWLLALVMPLMGLVFSMSGGLRGAGDTKSPLISSIIGMYGGRLLCAFVLYYLLEPPIIVIYCTMFPDLVLRVLIMAVRLRSGKWKRGRV